MRKKQDETEESLRLLDDLKATITEQRKFLEEIKKLRGIRDIGNSELIAVQTKDLKNKIRVANKRIAKILDDLSTQEDLFKSSIGFRKDSHALKNKNIFHGDELEKTTLKRLKKESKTDKGKKKKKNIYAITANKIFSKRSRKLVDKGYFNSLENDLQKSNLRYPLAGYVSMIILTTILSGLAGILIWLFFGFFSLDVTFPLIKFSENIGLSFLRLVWIPILFPVFGFLIAYSYPSLERRAAEASIDYELPFAAINMAAIAGSMINPINIFKIIISSKEFPSVEKELTKLMNQINVYGYDLVNSLRNASENTPSKRMARLFNGLATTINSGGDLAKFFDSRAESLLFEYRLKREKETKVAETFMDLYISIVIAAPMIFMLLLMMIKISGLGLSLSTSTLTLIMVGGVSAINVFFILFLHLKKTS